MRCSTSVPGGGREKVEERKWIPPCDSIFSLPPPGIGKLRIEPQ